MFYLSLRVGDPDNKLSTVQWQAFGTMAWVKIGRPAPPF